MSFRSYMSYVTCIVLLTCVLISYQVLVSPEATDSRSLGYLVTIYGYFALVVYLPALLFFIPQRIFKPLSYLLPVVSTLWLFFLLADIFVFRLYAFHIDGLLIKMFLFDFKGMGVPLFAVGLMAFVAVCLFIFCLWLLRRCSLAKQPLRICAIVIQGVVIFALFTANSVTSIWAQHYSRSEILSFNHYFPWYYPIISQSDAPLIAQTFPSIFPAIKGTAHTMETVSATSVQYPKVPLTCHAPSQKKNILIIGLESWQADTLNETIMPKLMQRLNKGGTIYRNHVSGGTATLPGLFSLFTGVEASYYGPFKSNPQRNSSVLINQAHAQGYGVHVFGASDFDRFNLRDLALPRIPDKDYITPSNDAGTMQAVTDYLKHSDSTPFVDFIFFVSSHSPYQYPDEYTHFTPLPSVDGAYVLDPQTDNTPYKNRYFNSLYYLDTLIDKTLSNYAKAGKLENTWIIITGDHAEEFNENGQGYWGHGSNFTRWQSAVPLAIIKPWNDNHTTVYKRTYHMDIVPTLMPDVFGCHNTISDYSNGLDISNIQVLPEKRNTVLGSYYEDAYLIDGIVYEKNTGRVYRWSDMQSVSHSVPDTRSYQEQLMKQRNFLQ